MWNPNKPHYMPRHPRHHSENRGMIRALVFDFDGLVLETELPVLEAWKQIYRDHAQELPMETWLETIGTADHEFDPFRHLEELVGRPLERAPLDERRKVLRDSVLHAQEVLPGVRDYIKDARRLGLKLGIASSSHSDWVVGHLARLGIGEGWGAIRCADHVTRTKPDPELYTAVTEALGVVPGEALALEDSHNGVLAAKAAGLICVAIPGPLTKAMDFTAADLVLGSLDEVSLADLLRRLAA